MIKWPSRATGALRTLFQPLQDIDIYVEDKGDEVFYTHLMKRIAGNKIKIARVFALDGCTSVTNAAINYNHTNRRALFLIDGDYNWVRGSLPPSIPSLYRINAYCIENYLFCSVGAIKVLTEDAVLSDDEAKSRLNFENWATSIRTPLVRLFSAYAVSNLLSPESSTVSLGVGSLCKKSKTCTSLDIEKVEAARATALNQAKAVAAKYDVEALDQEIIQRAMKLSEPLDIVSGKDVLLPLIDFELQKHGCRIRRTALRLRLALSCNIERFEPLRVALEKASK